tara:strand:+ start:2843 stop:3469 length:627 start_codon:yes stop_codon:yes gene_type:complete
VETLRTSKGEVVETTLTDAEAAEELANATSNFGQSLLAGFKKHGSWTDGQRPWAHKLAIEALGECEDGEDGPEGPKFPALVDLLHGAAESLKWPRIVAGFDDGMIRLGIAGERSRHHGSVNVTSDGGYDDRQWYGRISKTGEFQPSRNCPEWVVEALTEFDADPAAIASVHGQRFGNCCFCGKDLTTKESLAAGWGPTCADHWGLPWG